MQDAKRLYLQPICYLGLVYEELGEYEQALKTYDSAITLCEPVAGRVSVELRKIISYARTIALRDSLRKEHIERALEYD